MHSCVSVIWLQQFSFPEPQEVNFYKPLGADYLVQVQSQQYALAIAHARIERWRQPKQDKHQHQSTRELQHQPGSGHQTELDRHAPSRFAASAPPPPRIAVQSNPGLQSEKHSCLCRSACHRYVRYNVCEGWFFRTHTQCRSPEHGRGSGSEPKASRHA